jgi:ribosome recycling factor
MSTLISQFDTKGKAVLEHLEHELGTVRTGRAHPSMVEKVQVEAYGSMMPIIQLGSVSTSDARTLVIEPWDKQVLSAIEKGIIQANIGMTPQNDGKVIRLQVPELTGERRMEMQKLVHEFAEQARISVRSAREDVMKEIKKQEEDSELSEDEAGVLRDQLQKQVTAMNAAIEEMKDKKDKEVLTV